MTAEKINVLEVAADAAILRRLGRKYRAGRATPEEVAAFEAANARQMSRQRAASNQRVRAWWDLPVARACWEGDAAAVGVLPVIEHDGDRWRVVAKGTTRGDGYVYCHLASTTRFVQQRNGPRPVQIADWIAADALRAGGAA